VKWIALELRKGMQEDTAHHYQRLFLSFIPQMISHPFLTSIRRYIDINIDQAGSIFLFSFRFFGLARLASPVLLLSFRLDFGGSALAFTWVFMAYEENGGYRTRLLDGYASF